MKQIGTTAAGSVLVEMSRAQFENLVQLIQPGGAEPEESPESEPVPAATVPAMVLKKRLESIRRCLNKLEPGHKEDLVRTIRLVCQHTGGIREQEIEHILKILQKEDFLQMDPQGEITYGRTRNNR